MHKHLEAYIAERHRLNEFFRALGDTPKKTYSAANLSAQDREELLKQLECALSPENLCCDGELRGAALKRKATMLYGAKAELERLQAGGTYK